MSFTQVQSDTAVQAQTVAVNDKDTATAAKCADQAIQSFANVDAIPSDDELITRAEKLWLWTTTNTYAEYIAAKTAAGIE